MNTNKILVHAVPVKILGEAARDKLTIHFQKRTNGGGDIKHVIVPYSKHEPDVALIEFDTSCDLKMLMSKRQMLELDDGIFLLTVTQFCDKVFRSVAAEIEPRIIDSLEGNPDVFLGKMKDECVVKTSRKSNGTYFIKGNFFQIQNAHKYIQKHLTLKNKQKQERLNKQTVESGLKTKSSTISSTPKESVIVSNSSSNNEQESLMPTNSSKELDCEETIYPNNFKFPDNQDHISEAHHDSGKSIADQRKKTKQPHHGIHCEPGKPNIVQNHSTDKIRNQVHDEHHATESTQSMGERCGMNDVAIRCKLPEKIPLHSDMQGKDNSQNANFSSKEIPSMVCGNSKTATRTQMEQHRKCCDEEVKARFPPTQNPETSVDKQRNRHSDQSESMTHFVDSEHPADIHILSSHRDARSANHDRGEDREALPVTQQNELQIIDGCHTADLDEDTPMTGNRDAYAGVRVSMEPEQRFPSAVVTQPYKPIYPNLAGSIPILGPQTVSSDKAEHVIGQNASKAVTNREAVTGIIVGETDENRRVKPFNTSEINMKQSYLLFMEMLLDFKFESDVQVGKYIKQDRVVLHFKAQTIKQLDAANANFKAAYNTAILVRHEKEIQVVGDSSEVAAAIQRVQADVPVCIYMYTSCDLAPDLPQQDLTIMIHKGKTDRQIIEEAEKRLLLILRNNRKANDMTTKLTISQKQEGPGSVNSEHAQNATMQNELVTCTFSVKGNCFVFLEAFFSHELHQIFEPVDVLKSTKNTSCELTFKSQSKKVVKKAVHEFDLLHNKALSRMDRVVVSPKELGMVSSTDMTKAVSAVLSKFSGIVIHLPPCFTEDDITIMALKSGGKKELEDAKTALVMATKNKTASRKVFENPTVLANPNYQSKTSPSETRINGPSSYTPKWASTATAASRNKSYNGRTGNILSSGISPTPYHDYKYTTMEGICVWIYTADIVKCGKIDAIANAADSSLHHYGGVSKAISEGAGPILNKECQEWLKCHGGRHLAVSENMHTSGGNLTCKYVIHAVGPTWGRNSDKHKCEDDLFNTYFGILDEANCLKCRHIAIPLVSSGVLGVPKDKCAESLWRAIHHFSSTFTRTKLQEIRLINNAHDVTTVLISTFKRNCGPRMPFLSTAEISGFNSDERNQTLTRESQILDPAAAGHGQAGATQRIDIPMDIDDESDKRSKHLSQWKALTATRKQTQLPEVDSCSICLDDVTDPKVLDKCGHIFCRACIDECFGKHKPVCPQCGAIYGRITGTQPMGGTMDKRILNRNSLPGYEGSRVIEIEYFFRGGTQGNEHPNPGRLYSGTKRTAYLPDNKTGREVYGLLERAFHARLIFTIGRSTTMGLEDRITWNDIHHKTSMVGGSTKFGYPDPEYMSRVKHELADKGIK